LTDRQPAAIIRTQTKGDQDPWEQSYDHLDKARRRLPGFAWRRLAVTGNDDPFHRASDGKGAFVKTRPIALDVNGRRHTLDLPPETPLLYILRNDLGLNGPKFGCGLGECGTCAVLIGKRAVRACTISAAAAEGRAIVTLEGLGTPEKLHPVQQAFIEKQAAQCGYCLNGMIIAITALLLRDAQPDDATIRTALSRHLCRCGTHIEILAAAHRARELMAGLPSSTIIEDAP
jgi:nicotinate dehydrogenase subunit A